MDDVQPAGIALGDLAKRGKAALVALDGDDLPRTRGEQRAGQPAGPRADLDDGDAVEVAGGPGDARREVEVEEEILAEAFDGRELMAGDDVAKRRQVVDRAHASAFVGDQFRREAERRGEARRVGLAGAGEVERGTMVGRGADEGEAERDVDRLGEGEGLGRDQRLVVIHADRRVVAGPRGADGTSRRPRAGR